MRVLHLPGNCSTVIDRRGAHDTVGHCVGFTLKGISGLTDLKLSLNEFLYKAVAVRALLGKSGGAESEQPIASRSLRLSAKPGPRPGYRQSAGVAEWTVPAASPPHFPDLCR